MLPEMEREKTDHEMQDNTINPAKKCMKRVEDTNSQKILTEIRQNTQKIKYG